MVPGSVGMMEVLSNLERSDNGKRLTAFQFSPEGQDNWTGLDRKKRGILQLNLTY